MGSEIPFKFKNKIMLKSDWFLLDTIPDLIAFVIGLPYSQNTFSLMIGWVFLKWCQSMTSMQIRAYNSLCLAIPCGYL